jgi:integrase
VRTVATDYRDRHLKGSSDKNEPGCINRIIHVLGDRPMADLLKQRVLEDYLEDVHGDNLTYTSRNRAFSRLSNLITYCRREFGLEGPSPFRHVQLNPQGVGKEDEHPRRRGETFTVAEDRALIKAMLKLQDGGMMLGRYYCATDAGPRKGEMLALKSTTGILKTPGKGLGYSLRFVWNTTKSGKPRDVPITTDRLLDFVLKRRKKEYPFGQLDGSILDSFRIEWENVLLTAGLEDGKWTDNHTWVRTRDANLHWHDLRHIFATRLLLQKIPGGVVRIQKLLGHADIQTTMNYLNIGDEGAADAMLEANIRAGLAKRKSKPRRGLRLVS